MKAKVIEIFKKLTLWDKRLEIYNNGEDNLYPERIDRLIRNSVTASTASDIMVQYLLGKGFGEIDDKIINSEKNIKLIDFAEDVAKDVVDQKGVFVHVKYNANNKASSYSVIPFEWCRVGKKDNKDYNGKILVCSDWSKAKKDSIKILDVYNPIPEVIEAQVKEAGGYEKYKGQVYYYNCDRKYYYPLSRIHSVQDDCDSEPQAAIYKNRNLRKGFFGKTLVLTKPLVDDGQETIIDENGNEIANPKYLKERSEADDFKDTVESFVGADNVGGALLVEVEHTFDKIDEAFKIVNIESNIDADVFQNTETSVRENILIAFNNLPIDLVKASSGFFNSGDTIRANKETYWENTSKERSILNSILKELFKVYKEEIILTQIPLLDGNNGTNNQNGDTTI